METKLIELFESEERILERIADRLHEFGGEELFFPALQDEQRIEDKTAGGDSTKKSEGDTPEDELLGGLVHAFEEKRLFRKRTTCPLCGARSENERACTRCGTPLDGKVLKKNIRLRKAHIARIRSVNWSYIRIYDLLKSIGERGFTEKEWEEGIVVRNGSTEYRVEWDDAWFILRKDGVKMLETDTNLKLISGLWKLWKKGGMDGPANG